MSRETKILFKPLGAMPASPSSLGTRRLQWLSLAVLVVVALLYASRHTSTGPAAGTALEGELTQSTIVPVSDARRPFRLALLNMHGGKGDDGVLDLARTAERLRGAQFTALNEVHGPGVWPGMDQAETLGRRLGVRWLFAPADERWLHEDFGNGVLTSLDVTAWQRIPLPRRYGKSHRNMVLLTLDVAGRPLHVLVTHIDRSDDRDRAEQLRVAGDLFLALAEPAVLMGDMNTPADEPMLCRLLAAPGVQDPVGQALGAATPRRIDWILTRGLVCEDAGLVDTDVSDHPYSWADCRFVEWTDEPSQARTNPGLSR